MRPMQWRIGVGILVAVLVLVGGWFVMPNRSTSPPPSERGLHVVTTTPVLYSLTAKVLGDRGEITNLVPPGASPENYALRPQDAGALERADVLVRIGLNFERFLDRAVAESERRGTKVITASDGVSPRTLGAHGHEEESAHEEEEEGAPDPHVWVDPMRAITMVENIAAGLSEADPNGKKFYQERAAAVAKELRTLDAEFRRQFASVRSRKFIAFHPAWGYFAERYGLEQAAVIEEIPGVEPTAQELAELTRTIRASGVRALLSEPQFSPKIVETIAHDLRLEVFEVNPEGGELSVGGYEKLMRANVVTFVRALSES